VQESLLLFVLLSAVVGIAVVAKRFAIPYPIAFVVGGSLLAFVPHLPRFELSPDWVFLIILPPLLYAGGWSTDWQMFKTYLRPIMFLSIGLVVFTTGFVAIAAHALLPLLGWAAAFALGAIVSPPDAVAAGSVFERFTVPRRIVTILDGEGLVNDGTALVIYQFAIVAAVTGSFSPAKAGLAFIVVSVGGVAVGVLLGWVTVALYTQLHRAELSDYLIDNVIQLLAPYAIYLSADLVHVSGVLATAAAGVYVSRKSSAIYEPEGRLVAYSVWDILIFLLNGLVFLLIGLELRTIVSSPQFVVRDLWVGAAITALVIVLRFAWVYPSTYLPRRMFKSIRERETRPGWNYVFIVAWSGMRGIVSLAAALALPRTLGNGQPFPGRSEIILITLCVIFGTLVFQGLSLIPLLRWLRIEDTEDLERRELEVRIAALRAGIERLRRLEPEFTSTEEWEVEGRLLGEYDYRIAHLLGHVDGKVEGGAVALDHRLQQEALEAERREVLRMREAGEIPDAVFRKIEYDLDLANERLR
jgi:CPA1 family monovalent cation:H+ antiporter